MDIIEKIKELEATIDSYGLQLVLTKAHLSTIEKAVFELSKAVLNQEEQANFAHHYIDTLISSSTALCTDPELPFSKSAVVKALFELECYASEQKKKL